MANESTQVQPGQGGESQTPAAAPATAAPSPGDALGAKLQGVKPAETAGQGQDAGSGAPAGQPAAGAPTDGGAPKLDPEVERFAQGKGFDVAEIGRSAVLQQSIKSQMEAEREMNRLRAEMDRMRTPPAPVAQPPAPVQQPVQQPAEKSPLEQLAQLRVDAIQNSCWSLGCKDEAELRAKYPQVVDNINRAYEEELPVAHEKTIDWKLQQRDQGAAKTQQQQKLQEEIAHVRSLRDKNVADAKAKDPQVETNLQKSGVAQFFQGLANNFKAPVEFFYADAAVFAFMAKAAKAIAELESMNAPGGLAEKMRKQWEADAERRAQGILPASDSPLPPELSFIARAQKTGRGVSVAA